MNSRLPSLVGVKNSCVLMSIVVQVSWQHSDGSYTADDLRHIFREHGEVSDVVLLQSKKKSKGSALVQMATLPAAAAAAQVCFADSAGSFKATRGMCHHGAAMYVDMQT